MEGRSRPPSVPPSPPRRQAARLEASDDAARTSRAATDDDDAMDLEGAVASTTAPTTMRSTSLHNNSSLTAPDVDGTVGVGGTAMPPERAVPVQARVRFTSSGIEADKARLKREWDKVVSQLRSSKVEGTPKRQHHSCDEEARRDHSGRARLPTSGMAEGECEASPPPLDRAV